MRNKLDVAVRSPLPANPPRNTAIPNGAPVQGQPIVHAEVGLDTTPTSVADGFSGRRAPAALPASPTTVPFRSLQLGAPSAKELLGVSLEDLFEQIRLKAPPTPQMSAAIEKVLTRFSEVLPLLSAEIPPGGKESERDYLASHLRDLIRVLAKSEEWKPAITIYGTARSKQPGTPDADPAHLELYQGTQVLGAVVQLMDVPHRTGAGPGAMKAGPDGYLKVRELLAEVKKSGKKPTAERLDAFPAPLRDFMKRYFDGEIKIAKADLTAVTRLAPKAHLDTGLVQGVKIELTPGVHTFEQHVEPEIEDPIRSDNFLARKVGLWLNAVITTVDNGGWGTLEELLESLALKEEGFLAKDDVVVMNDSVWVPFIEAMKTTTAVPMGTIESITRLDRPEQLPDVFAKHVRQGVERSPAEVFEAVALDLVEGFVATKGLKDAAKVFGAAQYEAGDEARAEIEKFTRLVTEGGGQIRSTGSLDAVEAMARGVTAGGGSPSDMQILPYWGDRPERLDQSIEPKHEFNTFLVQKELLMRGDAPAVFFKPDAKNLSFLYSLLTLVQTGEHNPKPVLLVGKGWDELVNSTTPAMLAKKLISPEDPDRVKIVSVEEAARIVLEHNAKTSPVASA